MATRNGQKVKLLHIIDILRRESDEEHPLTANEICDALAVRGITAERKAIYSDMNALLDFGFDIIRAETPKRGFFLGSRELEEPEIFLLCDAVRAANFVSVKKSRELISKLEGMLSRYQTRRSGMGIYMDEDGKCDNEELFYTIDSIAESIENRHKLTFKYSVRRLENREIVTSVKEMKVSPYAMTWEDDHYYLIGNYDKYDNLLHLRIDRMHAVCETDEPIRHFSEVSDYKDSFDVADYTRRLFSMFGGETQEIELKCSKDILEQVADRFSDKIFIRNVTEDSFSFSAKAAVSEALVTWIMNYGDKIEALKPATLTRMIADRAERITRIYKK